ncbi:D-2-hydroxyacid dehydrogenase [Chitinophaga ginsengisegetis]|uniref:D-2-hydroxyacid dehydrogenase n=1 Tax=Chitinophaga ginsengisegetis TaxID=393003 RepID=UPI000DBAD173|nr:D-2-hydroxyacid dehydrogenase [Chitinophaga ginsengisegetis]MDR6571048.1 phosphoglycerate dehydrogenase-like enzyme [Chitinophaga ginsengisegetis]MDR6650782.1 phosphoglycerate dehydrogenase-like enzyme [Chitinophaga ginsengisegetis]MDR6657198.1 phosphoglycerate dehydrogenase-like enzyme [Chitinophaga ginsengisegetis]
MLIFVDAPLAERHKSTLAAGAAGDSFIFRDELPGESEQREALLKADILLGNPKPVEWLEKAVNLQWIQLYSTGFEYYRHIKIPAIVTNMQDYYSQPCAETAIAGILSLYRGAGEFATLKNKQQWVGHIIRPALQTLQNKQVIILGAGNIARRIEKILRGFDCTIRLYARRSPNAVIRTTTELEAALPAADIVIACLPGTEETKGLFTREMIAALKHNAIFCNVGRGNLLADEQALTEALMHRRIGGAVLDVTQEEPLPAGHPLWSCPNTVLSQHSGGGSTSEYEGIVACFLENLAAFKNGIPLKNIVRFDKGY